jgi:hypothetical protein
VGTLHGVDFRNRDEKKKRTDSAGVGVSTQNKSPQVHGWAHATPTPERMPARGLGWKDRRELANGRDWNPWPAGRGWPDKGTEEAHGGRVSTAKGAAGGLDDVAKCNEPLREGRKTSDRPAKQPRASGRRDTCHCEPKRASRWRDGSGLCIPKLRLLIPIAPPHAPKIPLPAPAIPLAVWRGLLFVWECELGFM